MPPDRHTPKGPHRSEGAEADHPIAREFERTIAAVRQRPRRRKLLARLRPFGLLAAGLQLVAQPAGSGRIVPVGGYRGATTSGRWRAHWLGAPRIAPAGKVPALSQSLSSRSRLRRIRLRRIRSG